MRKTILLLIILAVVIAAAGFVYSNLRKGKINYGEFKNMIKVSSSAFGQGEMIPQKFTCDGQNINPEILIDGAPENAKSLALIMDDPDSPSGNFVHWLVWNIKPNTKIINENSAPESAVSGKNSAGKDQYIGPCPGSGTHRYIFRIFALDEIINLPQGASRQELEGAMQNHILDAGELMGRYQRK